MSPELAAVLEDLADAEQPWIFLPGLTPREFWDELAGQAPHEGFGVIDLDEAAPVGNHDELLAAFAASLEPPRWAGHNLNALKDLLTGLPAHAKGWVILLRNPEPLSEHDPESFEALLDIVETVNDAKREAGKGPVTLVTLEPAEAEEI
jgi:hypothetical protein